MKFDYNDIPPSVKSAKPLIADKLIGIAKEIDLTSKALFEDMLELGWKMVKTCKDYHGIGLAAPQIGVRKQAFVMVDLENPDVWKFDGTFSLYINPTFKGVPGTERVLKPEGCLSVPGNKQYNIERPKQILASYWYFDAKKKIKFCSDDPMEGYAARMFQHEYDHLVGMNIISLHKKQTEKPRRSKKR